MRVPITILFLLAVMHIAAVRFSGNSDAAVEQPTDSLHNVGKQLLQAAEKLPADSLRNVGKQLLQAAEKLPADSLRNIGKQALEAVDDLPLDSIRTIAKQKHLSMEEEIMDSLQLAIDARNKAIDDSIAADSLNRRKKSGIDAPVVYHSNDSLVYVAGAKRAFLYGNSNVKYENMDLTAEKISIQLDSSLVRATGGLTEVDDDGKPLKTPAKFGMPVFLQGGDKYETDTMSFNFKTKKGVILNAYTEQEDGYLVSERSKRDGEGNFYLQHGRYTTCDDPHPDFYLALSRAKVRPGKDVVFGPAYLVVQDVPLPLAIPYGFFPFTKSYSSGFIMPTYGDETERGFYLRDGGYYFAISDKVDLKLLGEIYTKGSWGFSVASNYKIRYKFGGSFYFSYQDSRTGEEGFPDYSKTTSFKIQWSHRQDNKANPYNTFSASVNFATSSYERNNLTSMYNPTTMTQSTRTSSVSWSTGFSSIGMTLSSTANISQNMRDSTIALSFPDLNISISRFNPLKRKHAVGKERWYEKIYMQYTGRLSNSITAKEDKILKSSLAKDWRNGMQHTIQAGASFTLAKYITFTPSVNFIDRMYLNKVNQSWDEDKNAVRNDTVRGFYNVYNWSGTLQASTKIYGFFTPNRKLFGDKVQAIRHTLTPSASISYAPDFSDAHYGFYSTYERPNSDGTYTTVTYSPFSTGIFGTAPSTMSGTVTFDLDNNIEMKVRSDDDSLGFKKVSIIDQLGASMSYNMAAKEKPLSDLTVRLRLKWWKNYTFSTTAVFATYAYELDDNGRPYVGNHTEWSKGRFGRYRGISQNVSYTLTPEKIKGWFSKDEKDKKKKGDKKNDDDDEDTGTESNVDDTMIAGQNGAKKENAGMAETDEDGYLKFSMPWSLTFSYGITMSENTSGTFNTETMRYPYKFTQNLNFSGNIRISDGWNISFTSGYDFERKKLSMTTASLARDLHCFSMSCSVVLMPYTSYNFTFRCNAATLTDALKYDKRSGYSNSVRWY